MLRMRWHYQQWQALILSSPIVITFFRGILVFPPLPVNRFAINVAPDNMNLIIFQ